MKPALFSRTELLKKLDVDTTLVTGNQRLAVSIRHGWDQRAVEQGLKVWESPEILPWSAWLQHSFKQAAYADSSSRDNVPVLLNQLQEKLLWEQVINKSGIETSLLQLSSTASKAADAWNLFHEWQLEGQQESHWQNADSLQFAVWMKSFRQRCQRSGWITRAEAADFVSGQLEIMHDILPPHLVLTGFDELSPQQISLLDNLKQQGCRVEWIEKAAEPGNVSVVAAIDTHAEIRLAAGWARAIVEDTPDARVGIIIPELTSLRKSVQVIFDRILSPGMTSSAEVQAHLYNLSLGKSLADYPYVQTALQLLHLHQHRIPLQDLSFLITSPFLSGWKTEKMSRYQLDRQLREDGSYEVSKSRLKHIMNMSEKAWYCPVLSGLIESFDTCLSNNTSNRPPSQWAVVFSTLLASMGLSRGEGLSSEEFQTAESLDDLVTELAYLDEIHGNISYTVGLKMLQQSARDRIFQSQSDEMPIQILGVMEATGLSFDFVWLLGLHDSIWPASSQPNPFIPVKLQRQYAMPHSSAQRELHVTNLLTTRLTGMASQTIISYPCMNKTESLRKSNLLDQFPEMDFSELSLSLPVDWATLIRQSSALEPYTAGDAPELTDYNVKGGSQVIKLQALCPFRVFVEHRLGASAMGEPVLGMDAAERGSLVHTMLEYFWKQVKTQASLQAMSEQERLKLIRQSIERAIKNREKQREREFDTRYRHIEQARLMQMMKEWLPLELKRQNFKVNALEQKQTLQLGDMKIDLKIDRVDQLEDGSCVVVDYKTGIVSPGQWFGDRPEDPQLPLYSMVIKGDLSGVSFAVLRAGQYGFKGVTASDGVLPGVKSSDVLAQSKHHDSWQSLLKEWKETIESLADDFIKGHASVDPLKYPGSCTYCPLPVVCRVSEQKDLQAQKKVEGGSDVDT